MVKKIKGQTLTYQNPPEIVASGSIVGPEEANGPLRDNFDLTSQDPKFNQKTWEKGEKQMISEIIGVTFDKASVTPSDVDLMLAGDLTNQITPSNFVARDFDIPYLGLFNACATFIEALNVGSMAIDGGFADCILAYTSSHYQTSERQFRTPIEYGDQYPPIKQWTVTGAGAFILGWKGGNVQITHSTFGKIIDLGRKNPKDLGSAMAPAAVDTLLQHFKDLNRGPQDYDLIVTGDLGAFGSKIFKLLLEEKNVDLQDKYEDCGNMIFDDSDKYGSGGSGPAVSAVVLGSTLIPDITGGNNNRILVIGTGALFNPLTTQQNETIPGIAHALVIEKKG